MKPLTYERATRTADALSAMAQGTARPLAGGTDLLPLLKADLAQPGALIDVKRAADLPRDIRPLDGGLEIGALVTLAELERNPLVRQHAPLLADAAASAATPQLRNMATLGGNLLQRSRCWYFRDPLIPCWLKGGEDCPARDGENQLHAIFDLSPCVSIHPSDPVTALAVLDARIRVRGRSGEREVAFDAFFQPPTAERRSATTLNDDELVLGVSVPSFAGWRSAYLKAMDRRVWAFAQASVAILLRLDGERVAEARIALGGVAPVPVRAPAAEQALIGAPLDQASAGRAADAALRGARPLRNNGYKLALVRGLFQQAVERLR